MQRRRREKVDLLNISFSVEFSMPDDRGCTHCGSSRVESFEGDGPTGVRGPGWGAEHHKEEGVRCLDCGTVAAESEPRQWLAEAFQIVAGKSSLAAQREHLVAITLHFRELASALCAVPRPTEVN